MKTDDLIRALAADGSRRSLPLGRALLFGLLPGLALSLALYALLMGPRPHLLDLLGQPRLIFKLVFPWAVAACALPLVLRLVQPGAELRRYGLGLLLLAAVLLGAVGLELMLVPQADWQARWIGHNARVCLMLIPMLAFGPLLAVLVVLKRGAPLNPAKAGAGAGLAAAALGAALYATHCPDDSPLFVACWYSIATAIIVALGAFVGARWLRW